MEQLKKVRELLMKYPRKATDVLVLFAALAVISFFSSNFLEEKFSPTLDSIFVPSHRQWIAFFVILGVFYFIFDLAYSFMHRGRLIGLEFGSYELIALEAKKEDCSEIRVFASAAEDSKINFIKLTAENFKPARHLTVKVLIRDDGTGGRADYLKAQVEKWRRDVDDVSKSKNGGFRIETQFSIHKNPVMLKGYIFGNTATFLAWYSKTSTFSANPYMPFFMIKNGGELSDLTIEQAIRTFDDHFKSGVKL